MLPPVDTKNPAAVTAFVSETFHRLFPRSAPSLLGPIFQGVERLFTGRHPDYQAIDLRYHDFEHTLQATVCLTLLLEGAQQSGEIEQLTPRQFELAIAAALLHDAGYLKARSDASGTGAKYTLTHVLRSCAFAASYLPTLGVNEREIAAVLGAINCTGPNNEIGRLQFDNPADRLIGCALATADILGQMSAPDYPDKLVVLYGEFLESDNFVAMPRDRRRFQSPQDLVLKTPYFWTTVIRPRLETDFKKVYRFLAVPYPTGPNLYLDAVEHNIAVVRQRTESKLSPPA
ncbi:MAG: HD domain-containing protein [Opitutaceae bacterium]